MFWFVKPKNGKRHTFFFPWPFIYHSFFSLSLSCLSLLLCSLEYYISPRFPVMSNLLYSFHLCSPFLIVGCRFPPIGHPPSSNYRCPEVQKVSDSAFFVPLFFFSSDKFFCSATHHLPIFTIKDIISSLARRPLQCVITGFPSIIQTSSDDSRSIPQLSTAACLT